MRTCVVGTGALGGLIGARLALAGVETTLIDQGRQLEAIKSHGLRVIDPDGTLRTTRSFRATSLSKDVCPQDLVILAVKAYDLPRIASSLPALLGEDTVVLPMQNGIPWWYFERHAGEHCGRQLESVDSEGLMKAAVPAGRVVGCVAYPAASLESPGLIHHVEGNRFAIGELDGRLTPRLERISDLFSLAGFRCRPITDIRAEIWLKALGSVSLNPISALTGATMAGICEHPGTRKLVRRMMLEAQTVAGRLGITLRKTVDERLAGAEAVGNHRTSMLQDLEAGRPMEIDALVTAISELGRLTESPTPCIDAIEACLRVLEINGLRAVSPNQALEALLADINSCAA